MRARGCIEPNKATRCDGSVAGEGMHRRRADSLLSDAPPLSVHISLLSAQQLVKAYAAAFRTMAGGSDARAEVLERHPPHLPQRCPSCPPSPLTKRWMSSLSGEAPFSGRSG